MAFDLKVSVKKEITQLKQNIAQKTSELASLKDELKRYQLVCDLLNGVAPMRRTMGKRVRRPATVDWNSVLKELPGSFTIDDIVKRGSVKTKPRVYVRQVLVRWVNQGKIKRVTRGRYQKAA